MDAMRLRTFRYSCTAARPREPMKLVARRVSKGVAMTKLVPTPQRKTLIALKDIRADEQAQCREYLSAVIINEYADFRSRRRASAGDGLFRWRRPLAQRWLSPFPRGATMQAHKN